MTNNKKVSGRWFFYLGAADPEMEMIVKVLTKAGQKFQYATIDGKRVHAGNAYLADRPHVPAGHKLVYVECGTKDNLPGESIDHHRPGDPGYALAAQDFWQASSLGQVVTRLSLHLTSRARTQCLYVAAVDHCFAQALEGNCPGIAPKRAAWLRRRNIAADTKKSLRTIQRLVKRWRDRLASAPTILMAGEPVRDCTAYDCGEFYSADQLCLQQAAAEAHTACLFRCHEPATQIVKVVAFGMSAEAAQFFLSHWAPSRGLTRIYGVPERGYAGGYLDSNVTVAA